MSVLSCYINVQKLQKLLKVPDTAYAWELHADYNKGTAVVYYKELKSEWVSASGVYLTMDKDIEELAKYFNINKLSREWKLIVEPEQVVMITDTFFPEFKDELPDIFKDSQ